jgi:hypothetical protein
MVTPLNLIGHRFGRLIVTAPMPAKPRRKWQCICDCGNTTILNTGNLRSGNSKSCGCASPFTYKHGLTGTPLAHKYSDMKRRCYDPKAAAFPWYGGRGIAVCEEWRNSSSAFFAWALSHGYQPDLEIDRIDTDGDYSPNNCRFVTHLENMRNQRRMTNSISAKARAAGILPSTLFSRLNRGWHLDIALVKPLRIQKGENHASS